MTNAAPSARSPSVLFVCLGNICRSPLAEAALRDAAERAGMAMTVDSAGTGNWHVGNPPDPRSRAEALRHGIDIGHYRARQVSRADFTRFDAIIAMDQQNLADLRRIEPAASHARLSLLLDHVTGLEGRDVADPYYGGAEGFAVTWDQVTRAAETIVARFLAS
ncbi:low molecular weight phosphotyrosine protein phosphatase [Novosphingobium sp. 1949]|uniref:protein-tyrosine-phosphatase n=1 Tax=Novosphingobium organovorum TaxID=2930092 RepID=A0ABT0B968_9SPHN|nr:low molecular weight protein-tyrosine-phosphatase [Novosphingobium organovorum]MCJ2181611.1 low molecular weight phosphotyrosine protein phosphatase [Novosphingobium organovorum]